jgi:hypothetical protein
MATPVDIFYRHWRSIVVNEITPQCQPYEGGMKGIKQPRQPDNYSHIQCQARFPNQTANTCLIFVEGEFQTMKYTHTSVFMSRRSPGYNLK